MRHHQTSRAPHRPADRVHVERGQRPQIDHLEAAALLLGGERSNDTEATFRSWEHALALPGVRGLVIGRSIVYPADGDVGAAVDRAAAERHLRVRTDPPVTGGWSSAAMVLNALAMTVTLPVVAHLVTR